MARLSIFLLAAGLSTVHAQFPPPAVYDRILRSPFNPDITVSFKQPPNGTCLTEIPSQLQYTGYVHLPPNTLAPIQQDYGINTFFWFVEARDSPETSPLTIWLNGGPGSSSLFGFFAETGPCEVIPLPNGSYGTQPRLFGWDRSSNMLFIDQPSNVGLSYSDPLWNGTYDLLPPSGTEPLTDEAPEDPLRAMTLLNGTFGSNQTDSSANTTEIAAVATWHFLQGFFAAFPQYELEPAGLHLFAESYGGHYAPAFASYFLEQNAKWANGTLPANTTLPLHLDTVGIVNGLVDDATQYPYYPKFAYNNTYTAAGIHMIGQTDELNDLSNGTVECLPELQRCQELGAETDPGIYGDDDDVNRNCMQAAYDCFSNLLAPALDASGLSAYDIRLPNTSTPGQAHTEYLNTNAVQEAIGARVNYTDSSNVVPSLFRATGDEARSGQLQNLANLLSAGVRVALIYGDADYICNWYGGEAVSLSVASKVPSYASAFPGAGYADIVVNNSYVGGAVRQFGNLSFARVYDSGHYVPYYQPETAFQIFARIVNGTDISTGKPVDPAVFATIGPANATHANKPLAANAALQSSCWLRDIPGSCGPAEQAAIQHGQGVVHNGVWYSDAKAYTPPASTAPGSPPSGSPLGSVTGVFVATATPSPSGSALRTRGPTREWVVGGSVLLGALLG